MLRFGRLILLSVFLLALFACGRFGFDWASDSSWVFPASQDPPFGGADLAQIQVDISGARLERLPVDAGMAGARWSRLSVLAEVPSTCTLSLKMRTSDRLDDLLSDELDWIDVLPGELSDSLPRGRYAQWRAELATSNPLASPVLHQVSLAFEMPD